MLVVIVGDIHANLAAFQAVLEDASGQGPWEEVWCLGDTVGYGPDPGECIDLLRGYAFRAVAGNHDRAAVGLMGLEAFNPEAAEACRWTTGQLTETQRLFLARLPLVDTCGEFTLVHGSLREPVWEYLVTEEAAVASFRLLRTRHCLVSHSHRPFLCRPLGQSAVFEAFPMGTAVPLGTEPAILNPGSVGQPRDGDPRAAYLLCDLERQTVQLRRVPYDIARTQERMAQAGLPRPLIERLSVGR